MFSFIFSTQLAESQRSSGVKDGQPETPKKEERQSEREQTGDSKEMFCGAFFLCFDFFTLLAICPPALGLKIRIVNLNLTHKGCICEKPAQKITKITKTVAMMTQTLHKV